jgi:hypothetical protein
MHVCTNTRTFVCSPRFARPAGLKLLLIDLSIDPLFWGDAVHYDKNPVLEAVIGLYASL